MASIRHEPALLAGPSVDDVTSGADISAFRARLDHEGALALFDYWCRLMREHGLPMKHMFDPIEVPCALATFYMEELDVERQQSRMRLMGETLRAQWRDSVVGLCTDDHVTGSTNVLWKQADRRLVYFEQRAVILTYTLEYIDRPHCRLVDLALPMDDQDGKKFAIGCAWEAPVEAPNS